MITFGATVTASGNVLFFGDAVNNGTITGTVVFNDASKNGLSGTINGPVTLKHCSRNDGQITGAITYLERKPVSACPGYMNPATPFLSRWITECVLGYCRRRLVAAKSDNEAQWDEFGLSIWQPLYGPWQPCPDDSDCFAYPALYRDVAQFNFALDYAAYPHWLNRPGNPE